MCTRNQILAVVAVFLIVAGACGSDIYAGSIHIYGGDFSLPIPADPHITKGWMADAVIDIPDHRLICDLDVAITLTHTNVFDLQIFLQGPAGTRLNLNMYNVDEFFKGANYIQTIFDDEASFPIEQAQVPFTGRFRPKAGGRLDVFDGQDSFGIWRLQIYDFWHGDTGTLDTFQLIVATPEPTTALFLVLGTAILASYRPHRHP